MRRFVARLSLMPPCAAALLAAALPVHAQNNADGAAPVAATPAQLRLPTLDDVQLAVPRPVRAATAALGLGRQRLALVVGIASNGSRTVLDNAPRDAQAVAAALRRSGFVVMLREDLGAAELRSNLKEFRDRLQPGGVGFIYAAALGAQVDGHNVLLPRDLVLDPAAEPAAVAAQLRGGAVPLAEFVDALVGPADTPRLLVVDAAWQHPGLNKLPVPGLAEQRLPAGLMALFGHRLGGVKEVPAIAALPVPVPTEPAQIAASAFAGVLVNALTTPRISGPEALRATRRAIVDGSQGQAHPWLGGDTDAREELAEATLIDGLVPRSPEEIGREGARQVVKLGSRSGGSAGEQTVAQVLEQTAGRPAASPAGAEETARRTVPDQPTTGSAGNLLGTAAATVGAVGTVAGLAAGAAATAAAVQAVKAAAVAELATTAVGTAGALAAKVVELAAAPAAAAVAAPAAAAATVPAVAPAPAAAADTRSAQRLAQAAASTLAQAAPEQEPAASARPAQRPTDLRTLRNPGGGERPAYVPRGNSYGYAEGDTYTYRVTDTWKGEVTGEYTTAIEEVRGDGQLFANGQQLQLDPQGRLIRSSAADGSYTQFEPFQDLWWSNPQRGQSRSVQFVERHGRGSQVGGQTEWTGSSSVGRPRKLQTPAGEFEVLPIEGSGWWTRSLADGGGRETGQWSRTVWYSPKLGHPVAIDIEDADRLGKLLKRERIELLHAQTAKP